MALEHTETKYTLVFYSIDLIPKYVIPLFCFHCVVNYLVLCRLQQIYFSTLLGTFLLHFERRFSLHNFIFFIILWPSFPSCKHKSIQYLYEHEGVSMLKWDKNDLIIHVKSFCCFFIPFLKILWIFKARIKSQSVQIWESFKC